MGKRTDSSVGGLEGKHQCIGYIAMGSQFTSICSQSNAVARTLTSSQVASNDFPPRTRALYFSLEISFHNTQPINLDARTCKLIISNRYWRAVQFVAPCAQIHRKHCAYYENDQEARLLKEPDRVFCVASSKEENVRYINQSTCD